MHHVSEHTRASAPPYTIEMSVQIASAAFDPCTFISTCSIHSVMVLHTLPSCHPHIHHFRQILPFLFLGVSSPNVQHPSPLHSTAFVYSFFSSQTMPSFQSKPQHCRCSSQSSPFQPFSIFNTHGIIRM